MKFTISINQKSAVDSGIPIDIIDLAMIDYAKSWFSSKKADKMITEDGQFYWIDYGTLINRMPILGIKSKDAISRRFNALCDHGILDKHYDRKSSRAFFRFGDKFNLLEWDGDDSEGSTQKSEGSTEESEGVDSKVGGGSTQKSDYYNTIDSNKKIIMDAAKEFQEFIDTNSSPTAEIAKRFLSLGWKPKETVSKFREWLVALAELHEATPDEIAKSCEEWHVYWMARDDRKIKNFKTCFGNSPSLPKNKDKWKKN